MRDAVELARSRADMLAPPGESDYWTLALDGEPATFQRRHDPKA